MASSNQPPSSPTPNELTYTGLFLDGQPLSPASTGAVLAQGLDMSDEDKAAVLGCLESDRDSYQLHQPQYMHAQQQQNQPRDHSHSPFKRARSSGNVLNGPGSGSLDMRGTSSSYSPAAAVFGGGDGTSAAAAVPVGDSSSQDEEEDEDDEDDAPAGDSGLIPIRQTPLDAATRPDAIFALTVLAKNLQRVLVVEPASKDGALQPMTTTCSEIVTKMDSKTLVDALKTRQPTLLGASKGFLAAQTLDTEADVVPILTQLLMEVCYYSMHFRLSCALSRVHFVVIAACIACCCATLPV